MSVGAMSMVTRQTRLARNRSELSRGGRFSLRGVAPGDKNESGLPPRNKKLWMCLHFPQLGLDEQTRGLAYPRPCVLSDSASGRAKVLQANRHAAALGVRTGMPCAAARALGAISILERDKRSEERALRRLGYRAFKFSSSVSLEPPDSLLVEIGGSLKLFGGVGALTRAFMSDLRKLGFRAQYAIAPTPSAAYAFSVGAPQTVILDHAQLSSALAGLSLDGLKLGADCRAALRRLGLRSLADCRKLPRAGLAKRFPQELLNCLDDLWRKTAEPRVLLELPPFFENEIELAWGARGQRELVAAAGNLIRDLEMYLEIRQGVVQELHWTISDEAGRNDQFDLRLSCPARESKKLCLLFRESMAGRKLSAPVKSLRLEARKILTEDRKREEDLFLKIPGQGQDNLTSFIDRIRARYGENFLRYIAARAEHRPGRTIRQANNLSERTATGTGGAGLWCAQRPGWLLSSPVALPTRARGVGQGRCQSISSERERLENGWWDERAVARDFFMMTDCTGTRLWIGQDLSRSCDRHLIGLD